MTLLPAKKESVEIGEIEKLQEEITNLENSLNGIKLNLGRFEKHIHFKLKESFEKISQLYQLYKLQKSAKKEKRSEQKKKGKNYRTPTTLRKIEQTDNPAFILNDDEQLEIKRLYKQLIFQVHPDKILHKGEKEKIEKAHHLTAQLNGIYQNADLEDMLQFYQYVILGNSKLENDFFPTSPVNNQIRLDALKEKKVRLIRQIDQLQSSYTYQVLVTYENPMTFIDELRVQFQLRIKQLEKRTRSKENLN